jgi:hypothetical protein
MTSVPQEAAAATTSSATNFTLVKPGDKLKATFFATLLGQYIAATLLLIASLFTFIALCIALNFNDSLDQIQPEKQTATKGTAWVGVFTSLGGIAGGASWIYFIGKSTEVAVPDQAKDK